MVMYNNHGTNPTLSQM